MGPEGMPAEQLAQATKTPPAAAAANLHGGDGRSGRAAPLAGAAEAATLSRIAAVAEAATQAAATTEGELAAVNQTP